MPVITIESQELLEKDIRRRVTDLGFKIYSLHTIPGGDDAYRMLIEIHPKLVEYFNNTRLLVNNPMENNKMISIEMSPCQFDKVSEVIVNDHPEAKLEVGESKTINNIETKTGHIHTSQIDADYEYRPRENNSGTLVFLNEVKHGMYKMVSDETIGSHLNKLLGGIVCDEPEAEPVQSKPIDDNGAGVTSTATNSSFVKPTIQTNQNQ